MSGLKLFSLGDLDITTGGTSTSLAGMNTIGVSEITNSDSVTINSGASIFLDTSGAERMVITPGGSVGIGTSSPSQLLEINGLVTSKNYAWKITSTLSPYNRTYQNLDTYFSSTTGSPYFDSTTIYNGAPISAWNSTTGRFTVPETGFYNINLNLFINGASQSGRWIEIVPFFGGTSYPQYLYGRETSFLTERQIPVTYTAYFEKNDYFSFKCSINSGGTITLYLQNRHTVLYVNKLT